MGSELISPAEILAGPHGEKLRHYARLLLEDGDRLGLTSLREEDRILQELVLDSLAGSGLITEGAKVLDLGSGGGCPGIPLAIARPDCSFLLVEANQRKAGFLQRAAEVLELANVKVAPQRSEELAQQTAHRAVYDYVVAKAVAALPTLIELTVPFLQVHGHLIAYKGPSVAQEIELCKRALFELKAKILRISPYRNGERSLHLCEIAKLAPSPNRYPRRPGMPGKEPL